MSFSRLVSVFYSFDWSSWQLQTNEYGATDLQIEQCWIQMKGMHSLYQLQVVADDDEDRIHLMRPWKWATQSSLTMQLHAKTNFIFMCSHTKPSQLVLNKGLQPFFQDQEVTNEFKTLTNPYKYPIKFKEKKRRAKRGEEKNKRNIYDKKKRNINKKHKCRGPRA